MDTSGDRQTALGPARRQQGTPELTEAGVAVASTADPLKTPSHVRDSPSLA